MKVGAFDAYDDRQHLLLALSAYFGTTSVRKKALVSWEPKATYNPGAIKPQDYLDWEHELVGVYTSAHPADGIAEADIEAYEAEVEAHEKTAAYQRSKPVRLLTGHPVADILEHESARDDQLRLVAGMLLDVIWKPNRSGVGGRYCGRIEDSTAGANFTYWKPRDGEIGAAHVAFRDFEAAVNEEAQTAALSAPAGEAGETSLGAAIAPIGSGDVPVPPDLAVDDGVSDIEYEDDADRPKRRGRAQRPYSFQRLKDQK